MPADTNANLLRYSPSTRFFHLHSTLPIVPAPEFVCAWSFLLPENSMDSARSAPMATMPSSPPAQFTTSPPSTGLSSFSIRSPPSVNPPVNYVFVGKTSPSPRHERVAPTSFVNALSTDLGHTASAVSTSFTSSEGFRLQPRHSLKTNDPSTCSSHRGGYHLESNRGRKRRAGCLHDAGRSRLDVSPNVGSEDPEASPGKVDVTTLNLQSLSLKSPVRSQSPWNHPVGSSERQPSLLSSFSKFSHSPTSSLKNVTPSREDPRKADESVRSPAFSASSAFSSKVMPLKVLLHNDPKTPLSSRPPLPSTPARTFHAEAEVHYPARSLFSNQGYASADSPQSSLSTNQDVESFDHQLKLRRVGDPPGSCRSTPRRSTRPPPKISLTPRSCRTSLSSISNDLPLFPGFPQEISFEDNLMESEQQEGPNGSSGSTAHEPTDSSQRPGSFIPLPDWEDAPVPSTSWLYEREPTQEFAFSENQSLSDVESDKEEFILQSPAVIAEEKISQSTFKQRRLERTLDSSGQLSTTSLLGMNFISSNPCLATLDSKAAPRSSSPTDLQSQNLPFHFDQQEEASSKEPFGDLWLEPSADVGNLDSPGRDLHTPPTFPQPQTPPALHSRLSSRS